MLRLHGYGCYVTQGYTLSDSDVVSSSMEYDSGRFSPFRLHDLCHSFDLREPWRSKKDAVAIEGPGKQDFATNRPVGMAIVDFYSVTTNC